MASDKTGRDAARSGLPGKTKAIRRRGKRPGKEQTQEKEPRASTTDPEARDGKKLVSKSGQQLGHLPRNWLINAQLVNHR
jgi:hypothetical protein